MKKNSLKKLVGTIAIGLVVTLGAVSGVQTVKAADIEVLPQVEVVSSSNDYFGYPPYGFSLYGESYYKNEKEIRDLMQLGYLSQTEGELEIKFLNSNNEEEKNEIYKQLIEETRESYGFTDDEISRLKDAGYKNYNRVLDEIYLNSMVNEGIMTREEADLEIRYIAATNAEEREQVYDLMVDNMVTKQIVTVEQGAKLKADGYTKYYDNKIVFDHHNMIDELVNEGVLTVERGNELRDAANGDNIGEVNSVYHKYLSVKQLLEDGVVTEAKAKELMDGDSDEAWDEIYNLSYKYFIEQLFSAGDITREEADLEIKIVDAKTEEEANRAYADLLDYEVSIGRITQEEADMEKQSLF